MGLAHQLLFAHLAVFVEGRRVELLDLVEVKVRVRARVRVRVRGIG